MINSAVAGQAKLTLVVFEGNGKIRVCGKGVNENGDTVAIDRHGSYTDENHEHYIALTNEEMGTIEKAAAIAAAMLGGFEGGDVSKVETELIADREAATVAKVVEPKDL